MHPSLKPYFDRVELGHLKTSRKDGLILFGYTEKCTFDRAWDEYTRKARGIIFEEATGKLIATPFPKFFNIGEMEETFFDALPKKEPYTIWEKVDGSLGIVYYWKGEWLVATRGSLTSDQAYKAMDMLNKYNMGIVGKNTTLLVEIIYPENRIIADYGTTEELVILGANHPEDGIMNNSTLKLVSEHTGMRLAKQYSMTIEEAIAKAKVLPKLEEGFVVQWQSGLRVKIKGDEYMKIAKILSHLSPLSLWEVMVDGKVAMEYLQQIPEEFRSVWEPMRDSLEAYYATWKDIAYGQVEIIKARVGITDMRMVGMYMKSYPDMFANAELVWPVLRNNPKNLEKMIMSIIKPVGNVLKGEVVKCLPNETVQF